MGSLVPQIRNGVNTMIATEEKKDTDAYTEKVCRLCGNKFNQIRGYGRPKEYCCETCSNVSWNISMVIRSLRVICKWIEPDKKRRLYRNIAALFLKELNPDEESKGSQTVISE